MRPPFILLALLTFGQALHAVADETSAAKSSVEAFLKLERTLSAPSTPTQCDENPDACDLASLCKPYESQAVNATVKIGKSLSVPNDLILSYWMNSMECVNGNTKKLGVLHIPEPSVISELKKLAPRFNTARAEKRLRKDDEEANRLFTAAKRMMLDWIATLESTIGKTEVDILSTHINSVTLEPLQYGYGFDIACRTGPNGIYYPLPRNTVAICPQVLDYSESAIVRTLLHELGHAFDTSGQEERVRKIPMGNFTPEPRIVELNSQLKKFNLWVKTVKTKEPEQTQKDLVNSGENFADTLAIETIKTAINQNKKPPIDAASMGVFFFRACPGVKTKILQALDPLFPELCKPTALDKKKSDFETHGSAEERIQRLLDEKILAPRLGCGY